MSKNRLNFKFSDSNVRKVNSFFLSCELKPKTFWFKTELASAAYDIEPAYIYGKLGVIAYDPKSYCIIKTGGEEQLVGYRFTVTNPDTILLMDKLKCCYGSKTMNYHVRKLITTYPGEVTSWVYILSRQIISHFESIESVPDKGFWDYADEELFKFTDNLSKES